MGTYDHLFMRHMPNIGEDFSNEGDAAGVPTPPNLGTPYGLMRKDEIPESQIHMSHIWISETDEPHLWVTEHEHDYDEILIWTGTDPDNPEDLGGELVIEVEGEPYTVTTSGSLYIPAGVRHCPLSFNRVTRPFNFSALSLARDYASDENAELIAASRAAAEGTEPGGAS